VTGQAPAVVPHSMLKVRTKHFVSRASAADALALTHMIHETNLFLELTTPAFFIFQYFASTFWQ